MCPIGSAPEVVGIPPLRRSQVASGRGAYPDTGPPTRSLEYGAPRVSLQSTHGPTGCPAGSTGIVLAHWPVTLTATTREASTAAAPRRTEAAITCHQCSASWVCAPPSPTTVGTG